MLILIYGSKGWIGQQFIQLCDREKITYVVGSVRCDDQKAIEEEMDRVCPTHVISFIGRTHGVGEDGTVYSTIDYLEQPGKLYENVRDNLYSPVLLAHLCGLRKIHYTYLGTGCIYESGTSGDEYQMFGDDEKPNFFGSSYSIVKGFTHMMMNGLYEKSVLHLKIRMPITYEKCNRNFITKITSYEKICSMPNSMSILPELLPIALHMMRGNVVGAYNFTNPGVITHNRILEMYREIVDCEFTWKNFSVEEQNMILASKRSNNHLDTSKLEAYVSEHGLRLNHIEDGMKIALEEYGSLEG